MSKRRYIPKWLLVLTALLSACTPRHTISLDTIADRQIIPEGFPEETVFAVQPKDSQDRSLFTREIASKIEKILENKNYQVGDPNQADYCLFFDCKMEPFQKIEKVPRYIPSRQTEETKGKIESETGKITRYQEEKITPGTIVYELQERTYFRREFTAFVCSTNQCHKAQSDKILWQAVAGSTGSSNDLRLMIDYLLVSTFAYFGQDTKNKRDLVLFANDEQVQELRHSS